MISVIAVEIVVNEEQVFSLAQRDDLSTRVIERIPAITSSFARQRAKCAMKVAIPRRLRVANFADPIGEIEPGSHFIGRIFFAKRVPDYLLELFDIAGAAVIKKT